MCEDVSVNGCSCMQVCGCGGEGVFGCKCRFLDVGVKVCGIWSEGLCRFVDADVEEGVY